MSSDELNGKSKEAPMEINGIGEAKATAITNERKKVSSNPLKIFRELKGLENKLLQMLKMT